MKCPQLDELVQRHNEERRAKASTNEPSEPKPVLDTAFLNRRLTIGSGKKGLLTLIGEGYFRR